MTAKELICNAEKTGSVKLKNVKCHCQCQIHYFVSTREIKTIKQNKIIQIEGI